MAKARNGTTAAESKSSREREAALVLRQRLDKPGRGQPPVPETNVSLPETDDVGSLSVDLLVDRILTPVPREGETIRAVSHLLLGLETSHPVSNAREFGADCELNADHISWPSQADVARLVNVTRARVGQIVGKLRRRWALDPGLTRLRTDLAEMLADGAGILPVCELSQALLVARGSSQVEPLRTQLARATIRAAVEVECTTATPRFQVRRIHGSVRIAQKASLRGESERLGGTDDAIFAGR